MHPGTSQKVAGHSPGAERLRLLENRTHALDLAPVNTRRDHQHGAAPRTANGEHPEPPSFFDEQITAMECTARQHLRVKIARCQRHVCPTLRSGETAGHKPGCSISSDSSSHREIASSKREGSAPR